MDRDIANILGGAVLFAGAAGLYAYTVAADYRMGVGVAYDAGLMPRLWLAIGALSAALMMLSGIIRLAAKAEKAAPLSLVSPGYLISSFALVALFLVGFAWLGFWIPVLLFIPAFSLVFGYRNLPVIAAATVIFATATWVIFVWLLEVQMDAFPEFLMTGV